MVDEKWLSGEVSITRDRLAEIMHEEIAKAELAAKLTGDKDLLDLVSELLVMYSANVAVRIFESLNEEEE
jgi:hypothetical protein